MEKRKFERVEVSHEAELSFRAEHLVTTQQACARDLSMGGARIGAMSWFPSESIVKLELRLPSDTVTVLGSVRYAVASKGSHPYDLGIKFIGLDDNESELISQAIFGVTN